MKRIFIAVRVEPEETFNSMYSSLRSLLGNEKINWVNPGDIHVTLVFLGDTEEERIKVAGIVLKQKCTGFGEFIFTLEGTGVFGNFNNPRVLWAGIKNPEKLIEMNKLIVEGLKDTGFKIEERHFRPHITLGRIKSIQNSDSLQSAVVRYKDTLIQEVQVKEIILFESILKPAGPVYRPVGKFQI
jgi:2'-5' RNA ligase